LITITKLQNTFYLKAFSLDSSEFTKYVARCRKKLFKYVEKKGYTTENPKLLLEFIDELGDDFDIFVSDKIRQEIEDYNPYIPSFKPRRLKFDNSILKNFHQKVNIKLMMQKGWLVMEE